MNSVGKLSWDEFKERYVKWHEEFLLYYKNDKIWLIKEGKNKFLFTITSIEDVEEKDAISSEIYNSPKELLKNALFNGKSLEEIWDDIFDIS